MTYFKIGHEVEWDGRNHPGRVMIVHDDKVIVLWDEGLLKHPPEELRLKPRWWSARWFDSPPGGKRTLNRLPDKTLDPVFQTDAGWFFCDETWSHSFGPLQTEEAIRAKLNSYCHDLDHGPVPCEPSCPLQPTQGPITVSTG